MIFELRRIEGDVVGRIDRNSETDSFEDIRERAKLALMDCYEWDNHSFWPKSNYEFNNPENVVVISDKNEAIIFYNIYNMVADTKRYLTSRAHCKKH